MNTVFNTLRKPNGEPLRNVSVVITLSWDTSALEFLKDDSLEVAYDSIVKAKTDVDGYWSTKLTANSLLSGTPSVYKVTELIDTQNVNEYYIQIDPSEGLFSATFWVGDLLVAKPAWED